MLGGVIRGRNVTLRTPVEADLPAVNGWMADPGVRRGGWLWHEPAMLATWKERLAEVAKERREVLWMIDEGERRIGLALIRLGGPGNDVVELAGMAVEPPAQGRGLGADAALALHRYLFDYLNVRIVAVALAADNERARRILARLGYEGFARGSAVHFRDGRYADELTLRFDREVWNERWGASEREYPPHPPEAAL
ncbi:MAG: GNAT family N-acetyltransferase [Candidatus Limnocylindria bacterium]|nr:GNAT family N-acetyltransferase [Candidatus Limnocylindria bacterium]